MKTEAIPLLVIDDNQDYCQEIKNFLDRYGYKTYVAYTEERALQLCQEVNFKLILLDLLFPNSNGIAICKHLRAQYQGPIIVVSGSVEDADSIVSLEVGADCYLAKPINPRFLLAQISATLRRFNNITEAMRDEKETPLLPIYNFADFELNPNTHKLSRGKQSFTLSSKEYNLLMLFLTRPQMIHSRENIMNHLEAHMDNFDRSIDVLIFRLRSKLNIGNSLGKSILKTVHGVGYMLDCPVKIKT